MKQMADIQIKPKHVCLFGTSANPPTNECGHLGIIQHLETMDFDEIWVLPVYSHMFANKRNTLANFEHRYEMCQLLFQNKKKVIVSRAEQKCFEEKASFQSENVRVGTADVLDMLMKDEPNTKWTLTLGRDTFMDLTNWKWRRSRDILKLVEGRILVIHRLLDTMDTKVNDNHLLELEKRVNQINFDFFGSHDSNPIKIIEIKSLSHVSSTLVRNTTDTTLLLQWITKPILDYIQAKQLYAFQQTKN